MAFALCNRLDHGFNGFFAKFLRAFRRAPLEQSYGPAIRVFTVFEFGVTVFNRLENAVENFSAVAAHEDTTLRVGMPACAIWFFT